MKFYKTKNGKFVVQTFVKREVKLPAGIGAHLHGGGGEAWQEPTRTTIMAPQLQFFGTVDDLVVELHKQATTPKEQPEDTEAGDDYEVPAIMGHHVNHNGVPGAVLEVSIGRIAGGFLVEIEGDEPQIEDFVRAGAQVGAAALTKTKKKTTKKATKLTELDKVELVVDKLRPVFAKMRGARVGDSYAFGSWEGDDGVEAFVRRVAGA